MAYWQAMETKEKCYRKNSNQGLERWRTGDFNSEYKDDKFTIIIKMLRTSLEQYHNKCVTTCMFIIKKQEIKLPIVRMKQESMMRQE